VQVWRPIRTANLELCENADRFVSIGSADCASCHLHRMLTQSSAARESVERSPLNYRNSQLYDRPLKGRSLHVRVGRKNRSHELLILEKNPNPNVDDPNVFRLFLCLFDLGDVAGNNMHATTRSLGSV
jgi:hypothetical protein